MAALFFLVTLYRQRVCGYASLGAKGPAMTWIIIKGGPGRGNVRYGALYRRFQVTA